MRQPAPTNPRATGWLKGCTGQPHQHAVLFRLAPAGGCLAACIAANAGVLLPHPFTRANNLRCWQSALCCPVPIGHPILDFLQRLALWRADFPQQRTALLLHPPRIPRKLGTRSLPVLAQLVKQKKQSRPFKT
jgi:hypothetical protein